MKKFFAAIAFIFCLILVSCKAEITNYKITYHDEGTITELEYKPNEVIPNKDILGSSKEGYELEGWYFDSSYSSAVSFPYTVTEDKDFYARWIQIHTITLMNGTVTLKTEKVKDGQTFSNPADPQITGAGTFKGWSSSKDEYVPFDFNTKIEENVVLYAFFEEPAPSTITVSFMNGDAVLETKSINKNASVESIAAPTQTGYTFRGWSTKEKEYAEFDFTSKIENDLVLYAFYEINSYIVTYKYNDTTYTTQTVDYNSATEAPKDPIITSYIFVEWCTDENCKTAYDFTSKVTSNITLYAKLDPVTTHTLTLVIDGKQSQVQINTNFTIDSVDVPVKEGYEITAWYTNANYTTPFDATTKITKDTTLYGKTTIKSYTVTFINESATLSIETVEHNAVVTLPSTPSKTGYAFKGWSTKEKEYVEFNKTLPITEDVTVYAHYTINTYTVTFKDGETTLSTATVDYNTTVKLPTLSNKPGYTCKGWSTNATSFVEFNASTKITSNITIYTYYEIQSFTVTFMNGSTTFSTKMVNYNSMVSLPIAPTKTGHTFKGWSTNTTSYAAFDATSKISANTILYAFFDIQTFKVTFMNGNTKVSEITVDYNSTVSVPSNPSKTGWVFKGWSTSEDTLVAFNSNTKITSNTTIYAYFVEEFTVTFNVDGTKTTVKVENGNKVTEPEEPSKSGSSFTGWYLDNTKFNFNTPITDNIELVARFVGAEEIQIEIPKYNGYNEGLYFEATPVAGASLSDYSVKYKLASDSASSWKTADQQLIREQNNIIRCDIIGLPAGSYQVKIDVAGKTRTIVCEASEDDRSGYAHFNNTTGVGAYNNDGTLKSNAVVVYVTDATKNTVKATIGDKQYTGLVKIIQACTKSNYALDIRILGEIQTTQWNFKEHGTGNTDARQNNLENTFNYVNDKTNWDETSSSNYSKLNAEGIISKGINSMSADEAKGITKLEGLTNQVLRNKKADEYDSYYNMLDVAGAYNITIEGIGTDAAIFQWGFAFKRCNSIEIKNLRFYNYTEDAVGFEGGSSSDNNYGNYWVHNCTFDIGVNNWDVCYENDKKDGDGSSDVKYCHNVTISYIQYNKTHKTNLIGSSDSALQYNITLHHNYYNNCGSRLPLVRQTNIHMYNNYYYKSTGYSNSIRAHCFALVENCYYEAGQNPYETTSDGTIKAYNNVYDGVKLSSSTYKSGNTVTSRTASVTNTCKPDGSTDYSNFDMDSNLFYYDTVNHVSKVKSLLRPNDVPNHCKTYSGVLKANAKGFDSGSSTPIDPDPTETWTNQLNETFSSSSTITEREYSTIPPTAAGIYYSYNGGTDGSSTNNNVSISNSELLITDLGDSTTYGYYIFNQTYTSGKVKISIDFKPQTANSKWPMIHFLDGSSNLRVCTDPNTILSYSLDGGSTTPAICGSKMQANSVYTIVLTIDYSTNQATIQIGNDTVTFAYSKTINGIMFQTAGSNARTFSVDNIKIDTAN